MGEILKDKVVVITGGASGIGRATAVQCASEGAVVIIGDMQKDPREGGQDTVDKIAQMGGVARFIHCDVRKSADREALFKEADEFGGVNVLVNNAGIFRYHDFLALEESAFDEMFEINVKSAFFVAQAAAQRMVARGEGVIINLSSVAGMQGTGGFTTYCATKGAMRLFTMALADELGPKGVRVCAIHPGVTNTTMVTKDVPFLGTDREAPLLNTIALRRAGEPEDVAKAIVMLASEYGSYISGASVLVDGGATRI